MDMLSGLIPLLKQNNVKHLAVLFMVSCMLISCYHKSSRPVETQDSISCKFGREKRLFDEYLLDSATYVSDGRLIHSSTYEPVNEGGRSSIHATIKSYEFSDTSISITYGFDTDESSTKICINTIDSFILISVPRSYLNYNDEQILESNLKYLIGYANKAKDKFPNANIEEGGIVLSKRLDEWVARFSKQYGHNGVLISSAPNGSFKYFVAYESGCNDDTTIPHQCPDHGLPPFLIHSPIDYFEYFGPQKYQKIFEPDVNELLDRLIPNNPSFFK